MDDSPVHGMTSYIPSGSSPGDIISFDRNGQTSPRPPLTLACSVERGAQRKERRKLKKRQRQARKISR